MSEQTDVVVAGLDVVAVEAGLVGGEYPYWGCVPSKTMVRAGSGGDTDYRALPRVVFTEPYSSVCWIWVRPP